MRLPLGFWIVIVAACSPTEEPPTNESVTILAQTPQGHPDVSSRPYAVTWVLPDAPISAIDVRVQTLVEATTFLCVVWAPPVLGTRQRGSDYAFAQGANNGLTQTLRLDNLGVNGTKRRDRLLTCGADAPVQFHGLVGHVTYLERAP